MLFGGSEQNVGWMDGRKDGWKVSLNCLGVKGGWYRWKVSGIEEEEGKIKLEGC